MSKRFSECSKVIWQILDPSTKDTLVGDVGNQLSRCIDVSGYQNVTCLLFRVAGTGSIQAAALYAATDVAGTGLTQITSVGSTEATGLIGIASGTIASLGAGMIIMETTASDIDSTLADADFVTVRASFATATDELGVCWILQNPRYGQSGLVATGNGSV